MALVYFLSLFSQFCSFEVFQHPINVFTLPALRIVPSDRSTKHRLARFLCSFVAFLRKRVYTTTSGVQFPINSGNISAYGCVWSRLEKMCGLCVPQTREIRVWSVLQKKKLINTQILHGKLRLEVNTRCSGTKAGGDTAETRRRQSIKQQQPAILVLARDSCILFANNKFCFEQFAKQSVDEPAHTPPTSCALPSARGFRVR